MIGTASPVDDVATTPPTLDDYPVFDFATVYRERDVRRFLRRQRLSLIFNVRPHDVLICDGFSMVRIPREGTASILQNPDALPVSVLFTLHDGEQLRFRADGVQGVAPDLESAFAAGVGHGPTWPMEQTELALRSDHEWLRLFICNGKAVCVKERYVRMFVPGVVRYRGSTGTKAVVVEDRQARPVALLMPWMTGGAAELDRVAAAIGDLN